MSYRPISSEQAERVLAVLKAECGYRIHDDRGTRSFIRSITDDAHPCREWRFQGALGFGGKFRNNGNHDNTPYVDCYPEHETAERRDMIERANKKLAAIFNS